MMHFLYKWRKKWRFSHRRLRRSLRRLLRRSLLLRLRRRRRLLQRGHARCELGVLRAQRVALGRDRVGLRV
jgi:hypothetical protein